MTKEEWIIQLKEAQDNLNVLVEEARSQNNIVNLTIITQSPLSMVSLVSVELVNDAVVPPISNEQPVV
jgi:hypothetical protein